MNAAQAQVAEIIRQIYNKTDFDSPESLLKSVTPAKAVIVPGGAPYSIGTNIAHAEQWQRRWLQQIKGEKAIDIYKDLKDFPVVKESEWSAIKKMFLDGFSEAYALAHAEPFAHKCASDEAAYQKLIKIALHDSYHIGQVALLKRMIFAERKRAIT